MRLALGDIEGAGSAHDLALKRYLSDPVRTLPTAASNVLLFSGRPLRAIELLDLEGWRGRLYQDPTTGELLDANSAEPLIQKLQILGATGVGGAPLETALQDLRDQWQESPDRTEGEIEFLRTRTAPRIALALSRAPSALDSCLKELDLKDPLWAALGWRGEDRKVLLNQALAAKEQEVGSSTRSHPRVQWLRGIGYDALAVRLFSGLDSLTLSVEARDPRWGCWLSLTCIEGGLTNRWTIQKPLPSSMGGSRMPGRREMK